MHVAILGCGLMGGSIIQAIQQRRLPYSVSVYDTDATTLQTLRDYEMDIAVHTQAAEAVRQADIIIFALPPQAFAESLSSCRATVPSHALLMDLISVNQTVIEQVEQQAPELMPRFVTTHPMCGSEQYGLAAAKPGLYDDRVVILSPVEQTQPDYLQRASEFWQQLGATVCQLEAQEHDRIISAVSHLPHLLAFAFQRTLTDMVSEADIQSYAGPGLADFTRIAKANPALWAQIICANRENVLAQWQQLQQQLEVCHQLLEKADVASLEAWIATCQPHQA